MRENNKALRGTSSSIFNNLTKGVVMIKPLSFYVDKIINDLKEKGKQSQRKGLVMSEIVLEVENQLGTDACELARKHMISDYESEYKRLNPVGWAKSQRLFPNK